MTDAGDGTPLVGRRRERALLARALEGARTGRGGSATVLRGDPGIGKSALLDWTAVRADGDGFTVLRAAGHEPEVGIAFGALHQMLRPLWENARALPGPQLAALERVLGLREGLPPSGFMVGAAVLALLAEAARRGPVLILVDDLHWVDSSSVAVFVFLHQRIAELPVVMVAASRADGSVPEGLPATAVDVGVLSDADSRALLGHWHPGLAASTTERVMAEAAGNPLALAELPGQLAYGHRRGVLPLPDRLPLGRRLETLFARRLRSLPAAARRLLLLTALDGVDAAGGGTFREPGQGCTERLLARVEASGLARLDGTGRLVFRHPLVRSAVIASAGQAELREAHRTLAGRLRTDDPRRLLHEASAAEGSDEALAARLQEAGARIALRGGDAEGALLLEKAAALGAAPDARARRLTWAAVMSARGGRLAYAAKLVRELREGHVPDDVAPLFAYAVVYVDQSHHVDFASSMALLPDALAALTAPGAPESGDLVEQMFFKLLLAASYTGDPRGWEALERYTAHVSPAARLCHRAWADPPRTAHGAEAELRALTARMTAGREAGAAWLVLWAAAAVDAADAGLWRLFGGEHAYATQGSVAKARCHQAFLRGDWEAAEDCPAAADLADEAGYHCNALLFRHYFAHFLAGRGDLGGLRAVRERIEPAAAKARMRFVTDHLERLEALALMAHGRYEEAYVRLRGLLAPGELPRGLAWFHLPFFDLVVACARTGRRASAQAHVAAGRAARMETVSAHHAFLLAAATAVAADDGEAEAAYAAAYAVPGSCQWVFDVARLRLAHGSWLRGRGRGVEAREVLRAARRTFRALDAGPWVEQCESELRAAQGPLELPPDGVAPEALTPRELRIARLVATGLTNKEVGAALHVSPRTVGAHLYRIFPKLGISSRAALARALPDD